MLILPPPRIGGGPSNAILRCVGAMKNVEVAVNLLTDWKVALVNVGLGIRFDALHLLRLGRRLVYRADGCYVKEIFRMEGNPWLDEYDRINDRIKYALKIADHVVYQSEFSKLHLDQLYERKSPQSVIFNGVDLNIFHPSNRKLGDTPVIGCIGTFRLNRVKTLTDIVKNIPFDHQLLLVGRMDDQCKTDLEAFKKTSNFSHVNYIAPVFGDNELAHWHNKIDVFVHPFLSDWCPNSVVEALACGTPVVVPGSAGGRELIGYGGIAVEKKRSMNYQAFTEDFAAAIAHILTNYHDYSVKARNRAVSVLDVKDMAHGYMNALFPKQRHGVDR